jgi:hypothetical protein
MKAVNEVNTQDATGVADGTYRYNALKGEFEDYGSKWGYGYVVAEGVHGSVTYKGASLTVAMLGISQRFPQRLIGVWSDEEYGYINIDPADHYSDYDTAIRIAKERGELFIWDLGEQKIVAVPK